ncbi:MAG TPA: tripartite tricarboxylate transporter substrate binding protein [Burkholderiaceae bacterium]|jgi:tripartite-type tricarboxylate transporter receptor subunit TctC
MKRRDVLKAVSAAAVTGFGPRARAETWPTRPIRLISPYAPGGIVDIIARLLGDELGRTLGQPFVVDARPGAGGNIGTAFVARAHGDPYTLLLGASGPLAIIMALYPEIGYDPQRDFAPISLLAATPLVLVVSSASGLNTVQDLTRRLKESAQPVPYGSAGIGTPQHLAGELFKQKTGLEATHISYKGGAPAVLAVLSGEVVYAFENLALVDQHIKSRRLTALAVTSPARTAQLPEVPTMIESGVPSFEARGWYGLLAPSGIAPEVVHRLSVETMAAARRPKVQQVIASFGSEIVADGPESFANLIESERRKWAAIVKTANITLKG